MLKNIIVVLVALGVVILCLSCFLWGQFRGERSVGREMNALAALEQAVLEFRETQGRLPTEDELSEMRRRHSASLIPCDLKEGRMVFYSGMLNSGPVIVVRVQTSGAFLITRERLEDQP
jgi:hypothetical protein